MEKIQIKGFKCFTNKRLDLNKLTILTGNNGAGKSSVIQALLLLRDIIESCAKYSNENANWTWEKKSISLNGYKKLQLGSYDDICNIDSNDINISVNNIDFKLEQGDTDDSVMVTLNADEVKKLPSFLTQKEFYYLNAERIGPRLHSDIKPISFMQSGDSGENSGNILLETSKTYPKVLEERLLNQDGPTNFNIQVDQWMSYIFSDVSIKSEPVTSSVCQIKLRTSRTASIAPNTGFGYTYALPIVINGLIAKKESLLIIENPEAHLHPKAQSNMGFFIGKMVASGLKVVIETHSEHIVNGIRRAALSGLGLTPEDVNIYFFTNDNSECQCISITIDEAGNLSDFPVDFFDQVRQDMIEIIRLAAIHQQK